jgi:hypothetical protein
MNRLQAQTLLPIIQAWVEGKEVEYNIGVGWHPAPNSRGLGALMSFDPTKYQYRIKPEVKERYIAIFSCSSSVLTADTLEEARSLFYKGQMPIACIKITYTEGEGL